MAWKEINHACGHTSRKQFYGPGKDRDSKAAWLATQSCPECYRAELEAAEATQVAKAEGAATLPALIGSEKQVEWARKIRAAAVAPAAELLAFIQAHKDRAKHPELEAWAMGVMAHEAASWWIDNRNNMQTRNGLLDLANRETAKA